MSQSINVCKTKSILAAAALTFSLLTLGLQAHAQCGNGILDAGEQCDDWRASAVALGETATFNGCDGSCTVEPGFICNAELPSPMINTSFEDSPAAVSSVPIGFTAIRNSVDIIDVNDGNHAGWTAVDGGHILDLHGEGGSDLNGMIAAELQTRAGDTYSVWWWHARALSASGQREYEVKAMDMVANGYASASDLSEADANDSANLLGFRNSSFVIGAFDADNVIETDGWDLKQFRFTAESNRTLLIFNSLSSPSEEEGALIDDIIVAGGCLNGVICGDGSTDAPLEGCDEGLTCADGSACPTLNTSCASDASNCEVRDSATCSAECKIPTGQGICANGAQCASGFCDASLGLCGACGNGVIDGSEGCDDGANTAGDGCNEVCQIEDGFACSDNAGCASGFCNALTNLCDRCGNGVRDTGEGCDDGNDVNGDGCSTTCLIEEGNVGCGDNTECANGFCDLTSALCTNCGNGSVDVGEACDYDPLTSASTGCLANCLLANNIVCTTHDDCNSGLCRPSLSDPGSQVCASCGNGTADAGEACDDGNIDSGDGCSTACEIEGCGNGRLDFGESCDDGNQEPFDGCATNCIVEEGWTCALNGDGAWVCEPTECGDGIVAVGGETCDDGPTCEDRAHCDLANPCIDGSTCEVRSGDGCSDSCNEETGWTCREVNDEPSECFPSACGDGFIASAEECDDGNIEVGDGCDSRCNNEYGWVCIGEPSMCELRLVCGNGILEALGDDAELCDDGNLVDGDGCSSTCETEAEYECRGRVPSVCSFIDENPDDNDEIDSRSLYQIAGGRVDCASVPTMTFSLMLGSLALLLVRRRRS